MDLPATDAALAELLRSREALEAGRAWAEVVVNMRARCRSTVGFGLHALREPLGDATLLLHRGASEYCGAVEVSGRDVLERAFQLIDLDQESALAADRSGRNGVIIEHVTEPIGAGPAIFRLIGWSGLDV